MNKAVLLAIPFFFSACDRPADDPLPDSAHILSPRDLGIDKKTFTVHPGKDEVAIFRVVYNDAMANPPRKQIYDRIYWNNGKPVTKSAVLVPLAFYVDHRKPEERTDENVFLDSWRFNSDGHAFKIDDYRYLSGTARTSGPKFWWKMEFSKSMEDNSDLVIEVEIFKLPFADAKKLHPGLGTLALEGKESWNAAYVVYDPPIPKVHSP